MPEMMILLGSTEKMMDKDKYSENVPNLETTEIMLLHCNVFNNDYQQDSRVLYTFVPKWSFGQLLHISTKHFVSLKTFNLEFSQFSYIEV